MELSEKNEKELYYIGIYDKVNIPFLYGDEKYILIYDDRAMAEAAVPKMERKYFDVRLKVNFIKDKVDFFSKMNACGIKKYLLNDAGKILSANDFGVVNLVDFTSSDLNDYRNDLRLSNTLSEPIKRKGPKKASPVAIGILCILLLFSFCSESSDNKSKKTNGNKAVAGNKTATDSDNSKKREDESVDDFIYRKTFGEEALKRKKLSEHSDKLNAVYNTEKPYKKSIGNNGLYESEFLGLKWRLAYDAVLLDDSEKRALVDADVDWEIAAKSKENPENIEGVFSFVVGSVETREVISEILDNLTYGYKLSKIEDLRANYLKIKELRKAQTFTGHDDDMLDLFDTRDYTAYYYKNDESAERIYYVSKAGDRLVCFIEQSNKASVNSVIFESLYIDE